ncbi:MAG: hypothetical protein P4N41_16635 [Negativicutes bacterium]|nr:hypothetical protein [Negativicutes bacterium]
MKNRPEDLNPSANSTVSDDAATTGTESAEQCSEPGQRPKGRVMNSIRCLVDDFVDYTKKTEL